MPTNLPFGWEYDKVFGPSGGAIMPQPIKAIMERSRARFQRAGVPLLKAAPRPPAGFAPAGAPGKLLKLPQTATPGPLYLGLGIVIMLMGMALALTMGWVGWRRIG